MTNFCKTLRDKLGYFQEKSLYLEGDLEDVRVSRIQGSFNGDNELRNDRQDFGSASFEHFIGSHNSQESVRIDFLSQSIKEDWEIMMIIKLFRRDFPADFSQRTFVFNLDRKITSIVEPKRRWDLFVNVGSYYLLNSEGAMLLFSRAPEICLGGW